jgi:hypothetical protein
MPNALWPDFHMIEQRVAELTQCALPAPSTLTKKPTRDPSEASAADTGRRSCRYQGYPNAGHPVITINPPQPKYWQTHSRRTVLDQNANMQRKEGAHAWRSHSQRSVRAL